MRGTIRSLAVLATVTALMLALAAPAMAASSNCWGVVTSQRAVDDAQSLAEHASQEETPRAGLYNVALALGFDSMGDLGAYLADIDGIEATSCE